VLPAAESQVDPLHVTQIPAAAAAHLPAAAAAAVVAGVSLLAAGSVVALAVASPAARAAGIVDVGALQDSTATVQVAARKNQAEYVLGQQRKKHSRLQCVAQRDRLIKAAAAGNQHVCYNLTARRIIL
jgi:hypothetical protein